MDSGTAKIVLLEQIQPSMCFLLLNYSLRRSDRIIFPGAGRIRLYFYLLKFIYIY